MNNFLKILKLTKKYKKYIFLTILFSLLLILFSLFSVGSLIPILKILLENIDTSVAQQPTYSGNISDLKSYLTQWMNYKISQEIKESSKISVLAIICIIGCTMAILKNIFRYFTTFFSVLLKNSIQKDLRDSLHHKILHLPMSYFSDKRKGDLISRITIDIVEVETAVMGVINMFREPFMIIATLAVLIFMSPYLTIFVAIMLPISAITINLVGKSLKRKTLTEKTQLSNVLSFIEEHLNGISIIKAFVAEKKIHSKFTNCTQEHFKSTNHMLFKRELASPISEVIGTIVMVTIMWFGGKLIIQDKSLEPEIFFAYLLFFYQMIPPSKAISSALYDIQKGSVSADRIYSILDTENTIKDIPNAQLKNSFNKNILFKNVSFSYEKTSIIKDFNLSINKGETIALVGQSGGGKSTITKLINRFYDVNQGSIYMDNEDIRNIKKKDLRNLIGTVNQESILFNDSVYNNLTIGKQNASQQEVINACKIANAHDFISKLPDQYHSNIGEGGNKLSGGQKQRLSIARAILKNPPIIILDEATSALDTESEKLVQDALHKMMSNRTSIIVAHRLSTIQNADKILVIENGSIVEQGKHLELLEKNGVYKRLIKLQSFN